MKATVQAVHKREVKVYINRQVLWACGMPWIAYPGDGATVRVGSTIEVKRVPGTPGWEFVRVVSS